MRERFHINFLIGGCICYEAGSQLSYTPIKLPKSGNLVFTFHGRDAVKVEAEHGFREASNRPNEWYFSRYAPRCQRLI